MKRFFFFCVIQSGSEDENENETDEDFVASVRITRAFRVRWQTTENMDEEQASRAVIAPSAVSTHIPPEDNLSHCNFHKKILLEKHSSSSLPVALPDLSSIKLYAAKEHYPAKYPLLTTPNSSNRHRHKCDVCRKRTVTYCVGCSKAVCAFKCFSSLHS